MADTIINAFDGTFKTDGSVGMKEARDFLVGRDGLDNTSFEGSNEGSISLKQLYDASSIGGIFLAGNTAFPTDKYSLGGLRGASYQNNTAPAIELLGPSEFFVNDTESVVAGQGGITNTQLDGVIYKRTDTGQHFLFYDIIRGSKHRAERLAAIEEFYSNPDNAGLEFIQVTYQGMMPGSWNSATQTFSAGGTDIGNGLGLHNYFAGMSLNKMYAQVGPWHAPIDPNTGATSTAAFPDGAYLRRPLYPAQQIWVMVPLYLSFGSIQFWSSSELDPREEDRPQDLDLSIEWNGTDLVVQSAPGVQADGTGVLEWFETHTNQKMSNSKTLTVEAVVDIDDITINYGSYSRGTVYNYGRPSLPLPEGEEAENLRYQAPYKFSLYQK